MLSQGLTRRTSRPLSEGLSASSGQQEYVTPGGRTGVNPATVYSSRWFTPDITGAVTMGAGTSYSVYPSVTPITTPFTYAGEKIRLYVTSGTYEATVTGTVLVGGVQDTTLNYPVITRAEDVTPDDFAFANVSAEPETVTESTDTWVVSGMDSTASVAVTVEAGLEYSKNGGAFTAVAGTAENDDEFDVRQTSGLDGTVSTLSLTIGGVPAAFSVIVGVPNAAEWLDSDVWVDSTPFTL